MRREAPLRGSAPRGLTPTSFQRPASAHRSRRGASANTSMARPSIISAAPATTIHPVAAPGPVNASDPELATVIGSEVLELEDPAFAFVAAATVVDTAGGSVVVEP